MVFEKVLKISVIGVACLSLSACFGSSNGTAAGGSGGGSGGGGGAGGGSDYQARFDLASQKLPTQTVLTGSGDFTGEVSVRTNANAADADEIVVGDLDVNVNFDANANRPITATASNFSGEIDGVMTDIGGSLSTDNAPTGVNAVTAQQVNVPGQGATTFTGLTAELRGTLTDPGSILSGDALMTMQGNMVGAGGEGAFGASAVILDPPTGANQITGGTWYVNRD